MKPNNNSHESTSKTSSSSKSNKKSSKSRSKSSKNNHTNSQPTSSSSGGPSDSSKEKVHHRNYPGFAPKTIKVIWEQHDTTGTEIASDVYPRLAEDLTYKFWELVNNIKSYARHSGGRVTCDVVNEVLKDSDVPPILGAAETDWDRIECDGSFFFNNDRIVELRDEYLAETEKVEHSLPSLTANWVMDRKYTKDLVEFVGNLCNALFLGNEEAFQFALNAAAFSPQIGCTLKLIFKKCIEILAFEQKSETIDRCMHFLSALSKNPFSRDVDCVEQLFHLSQLLVCLLLGTFNLRQEIDMDIFDASSDDENSSEYYDKRTPMKMDFSPYQTQICDFKLVDLVSSTIGHMGNQFGYFQTECIFLIQRRMEKFSELRNSLNDEDYEYISRCVRGLIALGDYAFREFLPFLHKIDPQNTPDWISNHFSLAAVFLEGRDDIFLYEWLEDLCGDKLQPNMLYFYRYSQDLLTRRYKEMHKATYRIYPKILLKFIDKRITNKSIDLVEMFPDMVPMKEPYKKIGFRFAGCRPVILKPKTIKKEPVIVQESLDRFNSKIVIGKRKLFKPLTDETKYVNLSNFSYLQI